MELNDLLIQNNFSEKEAKVYLTCLQLKSASISTIARLTGEKRSTTYNIVKELQKKGIINEINKNKIAVYSAVSPEYFINKLEEQLKTFKDCLPAFSAFTEKFGIAPKVQFFEGIEGLLNASHQMLISQVDVCCFFGSIDFQETISKYLDQKRLPEKKERNIYSKVIISDTPQNRKLFKKFALKKLNRDRKIRDGLTFLGHIAICMYGPNQVMIIVVTEKEPFALVISSYYLYETLLSIFNFLRKEAED